MGLLSEIFRAEVKKTKDLSQINEMNYSTSYPTGFINLDFANGYIQEINDNQYYELGISDGSINMLIANSGVGKTTLATQIACNIARPFATSCIFYEQAEIGTNKQRIRQLSGFSIEDFEKRFIIRDSGITTESIYRRVKMIHDIKMENYNEYSYDTGMKDEFGNAIIKLEPTVMIIDSIKMVLPEKVSDEETNNMSAAYNARINSDYYTRMVPICREANIIMLNINHITEDINTGFMPKKAQLAYLRQGEKVSGGKSLIYIQNNIFRLDIKSKLKPDEGLYVDGSTVVIDIVKSRTSKSSRGGCVLVFDQDNGYDADLSLFMLAKDNNLLAGSGAYLQIPGIEGKFSQKKFKEFIYSNKEAYNAFMVICINFLRNSLMERFAKQKAESSKREGFDSPYDILLKELSYNKTNNN